MPTPPPASPPATDFGATDSILGIKYQLRYALYVLYSAQRELGLDVGIAIEAILERLQPTIKGNGIGGQHDDIGLPANLQRFVNVPTFTHRLIAARVLGEQGRAFQPMFNHRLAARAGLRIVDQPNPCARRRRPVERAEARIQGAIVRADMQ